MNDILAGLNEWGCDVKGALERFINDESMYMSFLSEVSVEPSLVNLGDAIDNGDVKGAFEYAHTLKGVYGNMGLTPMFAKDSEIVEILRAGGMDTVSEKYQTLLQMNDKLKEIIG